MIQFVENPLYNESNTISSIYCAGERIINSYIMEADLVLYNPKLIQTYQYYSNYLGIPVERTDDHCMYVENGIIKGGGIGGVNCYQTVGISYWTESDSTRLVDDVREVFQSPGGKELFWGAVPCRICADKYVVHVRDCTMEDVVEIDTFRELKAIDKVYDVQ